jgi:hypothetical protein
LRSRAYVDYNWPKHARRIHSERCVTIPINPPGWSFQVER